MQKAQNIAKKHEIPRAKKNEISFDSLLAEKFRFHQFGLDSGGYLDTDRASCVQWSMCSNPSLNLEIGLQCKIL